MTAQTFTLAAAFALGTCAAWLVFARQLRSEIRRECLQFRALGWNEHREQALAKINRKHPRDKAGQFTTKGTKT